MRQEWTLAPGDAPDDTRRMQRPPARLTALLALTIGQFATSCSEPPRVELQRRALDIIGGTTAASEAFDHTGALLYRVRASGAIGLLCSATLIGAETVVTAKHCVAPLVAFERVGIDVAWARGADFNAPAELVPIAAFARSPLEQGGAFGYGSDVAVVHLARPVGVVPALARPFTSDLLGQTLVTVGYGISTAEGGVDGLRRTGRETVSALDGNIYQAFFGDFETFVEWWVTGLTSATDYLAVIAADPGSVDLDALAAEYTSWLLLDQHEAVAGTGADDTQSCTGDSGGPLGRVGGDGRFETFAVVSGGPSSAVSACDYGQVFATFGPSTYPFIEAAARWTDPCGDVDARGDCAGAVARRCQTSFANGVRQLVGQDCGAMGESCVVGAEGAECGGLGESGGDAGAAPSDAAPAATFDAF
jgi:hypothetical protein